MTKKARSFTTARALLALKINVHTRLQLTCHTTIHPSELLLLLFTWLEQAHRRHMAADPIFQFFSGPIVVCVVGKSQPATDFFGCVTTLSIIHPCTTDRVLFFCDEKTVDLRWRHACLRPRPHPSPTPPPPDRTWLEGSHVFLSSSSRLTGISASLLG